MKINPKKCSFGIEEGPLLGYLITKQGIRANPSKVKAITDIEQPKMLKDIQSLNGKLADLSQFLSKGAKRSLPFFKVLKSCTNKKNIQRTQKAAAAVQEMKKFVETLPTLTAPINEEVLMMYLEASTESINAALFSRREKDRDDSNKEMPKDFLIEAPPEDNRKKVERKTDTKLEETKLRVKLKQFRRKVNADRPLRTKNSARNGNRKLGNLCRLLTIGKSSKGNLRSKTTSHQRVSIKNKGNLKKVHELHNRAH
ncbi:hypothetical protein Tco_0064762 [Tanacetum coccineum]